MKGRLKKFVDEINHLLEKEYKDNGTQFMLVINSNSEESHHVSFCGTPAEIGTVIAFHAINQRGIASTLQCGNKAYIALLEQEIDKAKKETEKCQEKSKL